MDEQDYKKQDIQKSMNKIKKGEANLKKKKRKLRKRLGLSALILIIAMIISYLLGFRFGSGDGSEGLIGSLMGTNTENSNTSDDTSRNMPEETIDSDTTNTNSDVPQVIVDENDIIYKGDSITLELLESKLKEDGINEVVLVDKASFYQTYQNVADLLTEMGITYTESR